MTNNFYPANIIIGDDLTFDGVTKAEKVKTKTITGSGRCFRLYKSLCKKHTFSKPKDFKGFITNEGGFIKVYYTYDNEFINFSVTKIVIFYHGTCIDKYNVCILKRVFLAMLLLFCILVALLSSSNGIAATTTSYNPSTGEMWTTTTCCDTPTVRKIKMASPNDSNWDRQPGFNNNLAPSLGNLGHHGYSNITDVDTLIE